MLKIENLSHLTVFQVPSQTLDPPSGVEHWSRPFQGDERNDRTLYNRTLRSNRTAPKSGVLPQKLFRLLQKAAMQKLLVPENKTKICF